MSIRVQISRESIQRANQAMIDGKTLDDFNLPPNIKAQIQGRRYTAAEINAAYALVLASRK